MFSLQKLLGKEKTFFDLLESSAIEAHKCAAALSRILAEPDSDVALKDIQDARRKSKKITEEISELVVRTFVTALEKEDIEALANALYKIPKPIEKFAERFRMAHRYVPDMNFQAQSRLIEAAAAIVVEMVREIRKGNRLEHVRDLNSKLQQAEAEADSLENSLLQELYSQRTNALRVLIVKDLYEMLEKGVDRCRDVGNVVLHVVLKNS